VQLHIAMTHQARSFFVSLWLFLGGCAPSVLPCERASWVDQVEDQWLVVSRGAGEHQMLRRAPDRSHWREGDAIVGDQVVASCRAQLIMDIRALRAGLTR
jgi:hypothetical protein